MWDALLSYSYKGNVRELRNIMERLVVLSEDGEIALEDLNGINFVACKALERRVQGVRGAKVTKQDAKFTLY